MKRYIIKRDQLTRGEGISITESATKFHMAVLFKLEQELADIVCALIAFRHINKLNL